MHRKQIITALLDKNGLGLEVGPSHDPVAPKAAGYNVHIVDHLSQDELKAKYQGHGVNLDSIEAVDFIWKGEPLRELLDHGQPYDWIIASHVIEHVPDPVKFLNDCQSILRPGGAISLAIPDKRYCFDSLRHPTSTGAVIQAHLEKRIRHTPGQIFDSFSFATKLNESISWNRDSTGHLDFLHPEGFGAHSLESYLATDEYVDVHAWVFTPHSFRLIIHDLNSLGYLQIHEEAFTPTIGCEFFVTFRNQPPTLMIDRLTLARLAHDEI